ncbi:hypothetical protein P691DRAFT_713684 [Macrolepiota fuliginosa MF-IS2]|uniref:Uncharacterized protein n=1 Tax=Macrolepiota fuliginosa MF-IS2 TaxID=1400762 RepID=A0A9P5X1Z3_9AGAR|nr:hypothetical protein P691DRAFT_713684 [Macrolepiota fuliginosa MF-IS2]
MLILLFLLAVFNGSSSAPLSSQPGVLDTSHLVIVGREVPECINPAGLRAMQDIVWSCLATIFACTWVAIHPNVPDPEHSGWKNFKHRVLIMFYAIVIPEFIMLWAARQLIGAYKHREEYNKRFCGGAKPPGCSIFGWFCAPRRKTSRNPWTLAHGFLLEMGGLMDGDEVITRIEGSETDYSVPDGMAGELSQPFDISEEEIGDKGKGDFLTKLLVVFQTTWFIVQCLARWISHLPLTELEVLTLAFAFLNIITCALWWYKPQNMQMAIQVRSHGPMPTALNFEIDPSTEEGHDEGKTTSRVLAGYKVLSGWAEQRQRAMIQGFKKALDMDFEDWVVFVGRPLLPLCAMAGGPKEKAVCDDTQRRLFYSSTRNDHRCQNTRILPYGTIPTVFGFLHFIPLGTSSSFPSKTERWLWTLSAIFVMTLPLTLLGLAAAEDSKTPTLTTTEAVPSHMGPTVIDTLAAAIPPWIKRIGERLGMLFRACIEFITVIGFFVLSFICPYAYVIARVILIILAFTTLRELPTGAYQDIAWSSFLPHF